MLQCKGRVSMHAITGLLASLLAAHIRGSGTSQNSQDKNMAVEMYAYIVIAATELLRSKTVTTAVADRNQPGFPAQHCARHMQMQLCQGR